MRQRKSQSGFVLLIVLSLVVLAGTLLAGLAWRSMVAALDADVAADALQRRWAVRTCRDSLLPRAGGLFESAEKDAAANAPSKGPLPRPGGERRVSCELAGRRYDLVFTDEQAKLNVNRLLETMDVQEAQSVLKRLAGAAPGLTVHLRTFAAADESKDARLRKVGSYGQVVETALASGPGGGPSNGLVARVTCWGDGLVNVRRAPDEVLEQACQKILDKRGVAALLAARERDPYTPLAALVSTASGNDPRKRSELMRSLTDRSKCFGLWVIERGRQRSWYTLAVEEGSGSRPAAVAARGPSTRPADGPRRFDFEW